MEGNLQSEDHPMIQRDCLNIGHLLAYIQNLD